MLLLARGGGRWGWFTRGREGAGKQELIIKLALCRLLVRETHLAQSAVGRGLGWNRSTLLALCSTIRSLTLSPHKTVNGGPTFSSTDPTKMDGSWLLLRGISAEAVKERVLRDIYAKEGAWDVERITVQKVGAKV